MSVSAALAAVVVAAASVGGAVEDTEQSRQMIANKISLLEMLLKAPAVRNVPEGMEQDAAALVETGQAAIGAASMALAERRLGEAMALLDDALARLSAASRALTAAGRAGPEAGHRQSLQELGDKVAMYRNSVEQLALQVRHRDAAEELLGQMEVIRAEAMQLAEEGQLADAKRQMAVAYRTAIQGLARMQSGEEILLTLDFATPADEYGYEHRRYESSEMMVQMMQREGRAEGDRRLFVDQQVSEGSKLRAEAEAHASKGRYEDAIQTMEQAIRHLNRALQAMGVPAY